MENYAYNKSFPFESRNGCASAAEEAERLENLILRRQEKRKRRAQLIIPGAPAIFEKSVAAWERVAQEYGGRISAKIDYTYYAATIEIWCSIAGFDSGKFMDVLHDITEAALSIYFTPLASGKPHIEMLLPYFIPALE